MTSLQIAARRSLRRLRAAWLIAAAAPVLAAPLPKSAPPRWAEHSTVGLLDRVTLRIHWLDSSEALRAAAAERGLAAPGLHGFSTLRRNTETGEYVCDVFVRRMTGALLDNDRTVTFGHEVLHCFGLSHP